MCGIGVIIGECSTEDVASVLQRRGPDHVAIVHQDEGAVTLMATVLHMRGDEITKQPVNLGNDVNKLCWNGEVYQYSTASSNNSTTASIPPHQSDTELVATLLTDALLLLPPQNETLQAITSAMSQLWNAEFAFCLLTKESLYYGRDVLGRRSLLTSSNDDDSIWKLSSVALSPADDDDSWQELPPGMVYEYNLTTREITSMPLIQPVLFGDDNQLQQVPDCTIPENVVASESMWKSSLQFEYLLRAAVERRLVCRNDDDTTTTTPTTIGVLFSGGLDSVVLAGMAADLMTAENQILELYNVTFGDGDAADRRAGLQCYDELKALHPAKDIRLVLVDIGEWESVVREEGRVQQLISPKTSVMDLNIGTALWFASRGIGTVGEEEYEGTAKILLLGMGADEQLGGYGRHRKAYHGKGSLREELDLDIGRIWERNLGRDDRVLSDHGKEARFPFLDPNVMQFLSSVATLEDICDFELPPGEGDKRILRLVAQRMGLMTASGLVKRAIQFGSRIAHVSDKQRFGSRRAAKGTAHFKGGEKARK